ncbi:MAG: PH domain-containing protein [Proteobacteria bacterium]|nr:PH domain-containing protein [Pseudomonadota bacterium]
MLYVQQSLSPGEEVIHIGRFHWIYTFNAILSIVWGFTGCMLVLGGSVYFYVNYSADYEPMTGLQAVRALHPAIKLLAFFTFVMGLLRFAQMMVIKASTEIAITNNRLIYKRGLVARYVGEMSIDRIEGVNVLQGILGRMLNYGRIMVRGMGVGEVILPPLENPIAFRKAIEKAKTV